MAANNERKNTRPPNRKRDRRFYQLLDLASEQNEEAIRDLRLEYSYDFSKRGHCDE